MVTMKRRCSPAPSAAPSPKRRKAEPASTPHPPSRDRLTTLPNELLLRILHLLPFQTVLRCQRVSRRLGGLAADEQVWKGLYWGRWVRPRVSRVSARGKGIGIGRGRGRGPAGETRTVTDWKARYRLRHNWSIGAAAVKEIGLGLEGGDEEEGVDGDRTAHGPLDDDALIARLVDGMVITVDARQGLRAWHLKTGECLARSALVGCHDIRGTQMIPTCLGVDGAASGMGGGTGVVVGFKNGRFAVWRLRIERGEADFEMLYRSGAEHRGVDAVAELSAVAYSEPYLLTMTVEQVLSVYVFDVGGSGVLQILGTKEEISINQEKLGTPEELSPISGNLDMPDLSQTAVQGSPRPSATDSKGVQPRLLTSLQSHTSWPPLSLSIRSTPHSIIASIAYSVPTYLRGWSVGLQELHLTPSGTLLRSRLASAIEQGFQSLLSPARPSTPSSARSSRAPETNGRRRSSPAPHGTPLHPTSLSYSHPYLLAANRDNTLSLYLVTSNDEELRIGRSTTLWGHTSSVSAAQVGGRGKAVSVSARGGELRVWELEAGLGRRLRGERSVRVCGDGREALESNGLAGRSELVGGLEQMSWVGFDEEVAIALKEFEGGEQRLVVYDFT